MTHEHDPGPDRPGGPSGGPEAAARRTVDAISATARSVAGFAVRVLTVTTAVCLGGFAAGIAALDGDIEIVWIVLASAFGSLAIGSAFSAWWRTVDVRRHAPELSEEILEVLTGKRTGNLDVIDTVVVAESGTGSALVMSRQMNAAGRPGRPDPVETPRLASAIRALTTFPLLVLAAVLITVVFGFTAIVFVVALAV